MKSIIRKANPRKFAPLPTNGIHDEPAIVLALVASSFAAAGLDQKSAVVKAYQLIREADTFLNEREVNALMTDPFGRISAAEMRKRIGGVGRRMLKRYMDTALGDAHSTALWRQILAAGAENRGNAIFDLKTQNRIVAVWESAKAAQQKKAAESRAKRRRERGM